MPFDINKLEINRVEVFSDIEYRVIEETHSGLLIAAKEEDVKNNNYPLSLFAIPNPND